MIKTKREWHKLTEIFCLYSCWSHFEQRLDFASSIDCGTSNQSIHTTTQEQF